jgi:hypothetical protein
MGAEGVSLPLSPRNDVPDHPAVDRIIAAIPVRTTEPIPDQEFMRRVVAVCELLDIKAAQDGPGIGFGEHGLEKADQPLFFALYALMTRRFGQAEM